MILGNITQGVREDRKEKRLKSPGDKPAFRGGEDEEGTLLRRVRSVPSEMRGKQENVVSCSQSAILTVSTELHLGMRKQG